ncbi:N-6 DNA methylase [Halomonas beimenensis]|uniref:site-specific DNA-methyltransferase (adenine-specific) n=1 Tax=Halomonas beimenensis TaxID=475662 RepID=A0A291P3S0_9GAMM|nr:class I SAM-dependent DNA methyltransferase [Halomonas beimenensis]ATJ81534.1 type I restriction-modification system, DNA-methyltransferase subunit M [Halomonas beimenensis]
MSANTTNLINFVFDIANKLRGPYRPPQYRKVMLPMTVLRRLDCVLAPTKDQMLKEYEKLQARGLEGDALHKVLARKASKERHHPLYNISPYTFEKLLADPENIATNMISYINGFSESARVIFEAFGFELEIEKLDKANRLYLIVKEFADPKINLHPNQVSNHDMGYVFEELVRKFNEQANEEAGDHFTPREVIRLMAHLIYTEDEDVYTPGIARTIYDPTAGTGGMLSVSEEYITEQNPQAHLELFGQEYNEESWAICRSDLLIKDEPVDNIAFGDTLGDGETGDGHEGKSFHYMLANPPFGVEWKPQETLVKKEHQELGFNGRFGPGLPRINDGATLFLLHMLNKMKPAPEQGGEGSRIGIVFNGSPLFNGEPGPSESNIRRWIIENDWLDAIIALPDQLFYNTGIYTYIWLVSNRKPAHRKGKVQLIDGTRHYRKMKKSLGNKRNELSDEHIEELTRLYANFEDGTVCRVGSNGEQTKRVCSKLFDNRDFGYLKVTVERPLRLNFQASAKRIERLWQQTGFINLAKSKKRKDQAEVEAEIKAGEATQQRILTILQEMDDRLYTDRAEFEPALKAAFKSAGEKLPAGIKKAILAALAERDSEAAICRNKDGDPEPDSELRDTEIVPLPEDIPLPLPIGYDKDADNTELLELVYDHCEAYLAREVLPFVDDAWIDHAKTKVGYEIPINRHFYVYEPPRPLEEIERDIQGLEKDILDMLKKVTA